MSFLEELRSRTSERVEHEPVEGGVPAIGAKRVNEPIGHKFENTYVRESQVQGEEDELVKDEKRVITDRMHGEKALEQLFIENVTFLEYLKALYQRTSQNVKDLYD